MNRRIDVEINRAALRRLVSSDPTWLRRVGNIVRDAARSNVTSDLKGYRSPNPEKAIIAVVGEDGEGAYVDVGYDKGHEGFYLWWHEVGTVDAPPQPHLRPALRPGLLD